MGAQATAGGVVLVNTSTEGIQDQTDLARLTDGGWVVTWTSSDGANNVFQQRYDAAGARVGDEVQVTSAVGGNEFMSYAAGLAGGGWVVTWIAFAEGESTLHQQVYGADGAPIGIATQINTNTEPHFDAPVTALADGGWVAAWNSLSDDGELGIHQQRFDAQGAPVGDEVRVHARDGLHFLPEVTALADGGWVVAWMTDSQDRTRAQIYQQRFSADGVAIGGEARVDMSAAHDDVPVVSALADGGWVVTWTRHDAAMNSNVLLQRRYGADGVATGGEKRVNTDLESNVMQQQVAALEDGGWVVIWKGLDADEQHLYQRRYDAAGKAVGPETILDTAPRGETPFDFDSGISVTGLADGSWVVTWPGADGDVHQCHFAPDVIGADQADVLAGTAWDERLAGHAGDDRINGRAGADTMIGGDGDDTFVVDHAGDEAVDGVAQGFDQVLASVTYQLTGSIENLVLTGDGDIAGTGSKGANTLQGNRGDNVLHGKAGDDTLHGGFGQDSLTGGVGADVFSFADVRHSRPTRFDVITDFQQGTDRIDLSQFDADLGSDGRQAWTFIGAAAFGADATGQLRYVFDGSTLALHGSTDADGEAEFVVQLTGATEILAGDLLL